MEWSILYDFQLLRVVLVDKQTGICLFEKVFTWIGNSVQEGICNLIVTFYKLSKDLGDDKGRSSSVLRPSNASFANCFV